MLPVWQDPLLAVGNKLCIKTVVSEALQDLSISHAFPTTWQVFVAGSFYNDSTYLFIPHHYGIGYANEHVRCVVIQLSCSQNLSDMST